MGLGVLIRTGYNIIHIVPNAGLANEAFDFDELDKFLDIMDDLELWLMFDMRKWLLNNASHSLISSRLDIQESYLGRAPSEQDQKA